MTARCDVTERCECRERGPVTGGAFDLEAAAQFTQPVAHRMQAVAALRRAVMRAVVRAIVGTVPGTRVKTAAVVDDVERVDGVEALEAVGVVPGRREAPRPPVVIELETP